MLEKNTFQGLDHGTGREVRMVVSSGSRSPQVGSSLLTHWCLGADTARDTDGFQSLSLLPIFLPFIDRKYLDLPITLPVLIWMAVRGGEVSQSSSPLPSSVVCAGRAVSRAQLPSSAAVPAVVSLMVQGVPWGCLCSWELAAVTAGLNQQQESNTPSSLRKNRE